ncbi:phosphatase PAP2 family protein [Catalinimonas alkaloidigena]|uniref:phosphatase PAP2 family protein n=1 Tax=Catalinimonas alkaloidigena TaxID=1075417 RepID=UPI002406B51E|nr:phosphatase PAP2 family protein [Catalinimonas alkaloidigena]
MHPLLMPTFLFALLFYYSPVITQPINSKAANYLLLAVFITTFLLPMVSITALRFSDFLHKGKLNAFSIPRRKDRVIPFFFTSLFYIITTYMFFSKFKVSQVLVIILAAITLIILSVSLLTLFIKVSAHSASASAFIGFLLGLGLKYPQEKLVWPLLLILLFGGLVMSARLYLDTHRPVEVLIGSVLGLTLSLSSIVLFL